MMRIPTVILAALLVLFLGGHAQAGVSWIANGSFEYDGSIGNINSEIPSGWDDVNLPSDFSGVVSPSWATDGGYGLALWSSSYGTFNPDDIATISQYVYMGDVNEIIFDIKLETNPSYDSWDSAVRSAVIMIDEDIVWDSNSLGTGDLSGEYLDQVVDLNEINTYRDGERHLLTLGLRSNVSEEWPLVEYFARWDFFGFDTYCRGGIGFLEADFNYDCFVDKYDLQMFTDHWLDEVNEPNIFNLYDSNSIDFMDYAIFADYWMSSSYGQEQEFLEFDDNSDGIVNFIDFAMLTQQWESEGIDYEELAALADEWLETNWMYQLKK